MGAANAKADLRRYRDGYPGQEDRADLNENVRFYRNEIPSRPRGRLVEDIHDGWLGAYDLLESHHGYIQWLFPIREHGMNGEAQPLQAHEAAAMRDDPAVTRRLIASYRLMLDFYGFKMVDEESGKLQRADNWRDRFSNLSLHSHNYLRITRILKCLGELGLERLKLPFLEMFVHEVFVTGKLRACERSLKDYWSETLRDDTQRAMLHDLIRIHDPRHVGDGEGEGAEDGDGARRKDRPHGGSATSSRPAPSAESSTQRSDGDGEGGSSGDSGQRVDGDERSDEDASPDIGAHE